MSLNMSPCFLLYILFALKYTAVAGTLTNSSLTFVCVNNEKISLGSCDGANCPNVKQMKNQTARTVILQLYCYEWTNESKEVCGSNLSETTHQLPSTRISLEDSISTMQRKTCPVITESQGALKKCEVKWGPEKGMIPCDKPAPVGTRVSLECPTFYERVRGSSSILCLYDGTWSDEPLSCRPVCGRRPSEAVPLIVSGWEVDLNKSPPWQATLFSKRTGKWAFFCAGTLIAERVVLTAAHCAWRISPNTIRVAFAIAFSDIGSLSEESQVVDVERIEIPDSYQDYEGNYGSDLALLILKRPVTVNHFVAPACIDFDSDDILREAQEYGRIGLTAGFGYTENKTHSETLRMTTLKIVTDRVCRENQKADFRKYLTYTSFCAGWINGTGVCNGDSGGGLVLEKGSSSSWYVNGVVSISPRKLGTSVCDPMHYTIFTKIYVYRDWIRGIISKIPTLDLSGTRKIELPQINI